MGKRGLRFGLGRCRREKALFCLHKHESMAVCHPCMREAEQVSMLVAWYFSNTNGASYVTRSVFYDGHTRSHHSYLKTVIN